jgi:manganese transport protein
MTFSDIITPIGQSNASLPEVNSTIKVPRTGSFWKKLFAFSGPGLMVAVGYMDPGNWATDIAGGSQFGYTLLSVILISNLFAMLLQHLSLRLGIATGLDLAQACRSYYSKPVSLVLWFLCELAIIATDLAEVVGSAVALQLLFGIPMPVGVTITAIDVFLLLYLQNKGFRWLEALVAVLIFTILCCFAYEMVVTNPNVPDMLRGLIPKAEIIFNPSMLYVSIGILGATVMPHNLYLHSSIVQTRDYDRSLPGKREAIKFATIDSTLALGIAFFINAAILITAAAAFHANGLYEVADIHDAHKLLDPVLGVKFAAVLFGVALLAAGQNATLTGTLAGQIVMEGFLHLKMVPWVRRIITRLIAIIPAFIIAIWYGNEGTGALLVFSQVILSLQLPFAVVPLVLFTTNPKFMGTLVAPAWIKWTSFAVAAVIICLNVWLLGQMMF